MKFPFFWRKENVINRDPISKEQAEQTFVGRNHDLDAIRERLEREYPSAESAVEDYRKGYVSEAQLVLRFSPEEIDTIHAERDERDAEDAEIPSGYL